MTNATETTFKALTAAGFKFASGNVYERRLGKLGLVAIVNRGLVNKGADSYMEERISVYTVDFETKNRVLAGMFSIDNFIENHTAMVA